MRPLPRCSPGGPAWWERAADTGLVTPRRRAPRSRDREGTWSEVGLSRGRRARAGQQGPGRPPGPRPGQCPEAAGQQPPPPPRLEVPPAQKPELVLWPGHANARSPGRSSGHQRGCWTRSAERAVGMQTAHSAHASRPGAGPGQPRRALAGPSLAGRHAGAVWPPAEAGQILPGGAHFGGDVPAPLVGTPEAAGPAGQEGRGGQCRTFLPVAQELGGVRRGPGQAPPRAPRHHPHALIAVHPLVLVLRPADELGGTGGCGGGRRPHISVRPEEPLALASGRPLSRPSSALGPRWSPRPVDTGGPRQLVWVLGRCGCHQVAKWTTPAPSFFPRHGARGAWL